LTGFRIILLNFDSVIQAGPCLKNTATNAEIIEAMKSPLSGLTFISAQQNLPSSTFIAADGVNWLMLRMEGVSTQEKAARVWFSTVQFYRL
jgi:hypothetical protein